MSARHDWGTHYLGWLFYKNEPWHFPLGHVTNYFYPIGTNVGFTDSIPLFAIFFKLFSPLLPSDFQYFGIWLLTCHLLVAYFTILLLRHFKIKDLYIFISVIFIAANPVLVYRGLHPALCAQWLIIASLYVYCLNPEITKPSKILKYQLYLSALAALINPYLCFMMLGFNVVISIRLAFFDRVITKKRFLLYQLSTAASIFLLWYLIGMVNFNKSEDLGVSGGYGLYSLNLNALFNSWGYSSFLAPMKIVSWHQYEGFMYLGMGIFVLLAVILAIRFSSFLLNREIQNTRATGYGFAKNRHIPMVILIACFVLFSITNIVSLNNKILFTIPLPSILVNLGEIFRASSRFFWLPYYLIFFFCIYFVSKSSIPVALKSFILIIALLVQLYDTSPLLTFRKMPSGSYNPPLNENLKSLIGEFDQIIFWPPFQASYVVGMDYQDFSYLAGIAGKPINTGYVARLDNKAMSIYRDSLLAKIREGEIHSRALFITDSSHLWDFALAIQTGVVQVNKIDKYYCLSNKVQANAVARMKIPGNAGADYQDSTLRLLSQKTSFLPAVFPEPGSDRKIDFNIEKQSDGEDFVRLDGWAFINTTADNKGDSVFFTLTDGKNSYIAPAKKFLRPDITSHFHKNYLDDAGFSAIIFKDKVKRGRYNLGLAIKNVHGEMFYQQTDAFVNIDYQEATIIEKIDSLPEKADIEYGLDLYEDSRRMISVGGWAGFKDQDYINCISYLVLVNPETSYKVPVVRVLRPDVTLSRAGKYLLDSCGFNARILKDSLPKGIYKVGVIIVDKKLNRKGLVFINKSVTIPEP